MADISMEKPIAMRLVLMNYCWIFVCLLFATGNGLDCDKLTQTLVLENDPKVCTQNGLGLGNYDQFVTLDFSKVDNNVLDEFLGQKFTKISGAIKMEKNSQVDHINFAKIENLNGLNVPENEVFINIRNNPRLTRFQWEVPQLLITPSSKTTYLYLYNNPLLEADSLAQIRKAIPPATAIKTFIQSEPSECWFEDPLDPKIYTPPTPEILKNCKSIKGDLILAGGKLKEKLKLSDDACLKLTGVDMTGVTLVASKGKGTVICKDGSTKSEVTGNAHLCGQELKKLVDYFPAGTAVKIEMDPGTCTIDCKDVTDVIDKYNYCKTIKIDASIADWFSGGDLKEKPNHLVSSEGLTIHGGSMTKISFPKLTSAKSLTIQDNAELTELDLPALTTLTNVIIERSPKLTLAKINQALAKVTPAASTVECRLTPTDIIKDFNDLRLCSTVIGVLTLEGVTQAPASFNVKKIEGCVLIRNTQLSSLSFLDIDISGCIGGQHLVTGDNPSLCKIDHLDSQKKIPVTFNGEYRQECGKVCKRLDDDDCETLDGKLEFTSKTHPPAKKLKKLKTVLKGLEIDQSPAASIDIPSLVEIQAPTAPALKITDNLALKSLTMKKLKSIIVTDKTSPRVLITGNKKLKKETLKQFLPSALYDQCVDEDPSCQYVDGVKDGSSDGGLSNTDIIIIGVAAFLLVALLIGGAVGGYFLWKRNKKKKEKKEVKKEVKKPESLKTAKEPEEEKKEDDDDDENYDDNLVEEQAPGGKLWKEVKPSQCFYFKILKIEHNNTYESTAKLGYENLTKEGVNILCEINLSLSSHDDFFFWRCQLKGIPDMKDCKKGNKVLEPAMINQRMLLNRNVHLVNGDYKQHYPEFLQALIDKIEVIPENAKDDKPDGKKSNGKNSRKPGGGGENATKNEKSTEKTSAIKTNPKAPDNRKTTEKTSANKTNPKAPANESATKKPEAKKPKAPKNYKTVHIFHVGSGFADTIEQIRIGYKKSREEREAKAKKEASEKRKANSERKERKEREGKVKMLRGQAGKDEESEEEKEEEKTSTEKVKRMAEASAGNNNNNNNTPKSSSQADSPAANNQANIGEGLKNETDERRVDGPYIKFTEFNRVKLSNVDGYYLYETTGALVFAKPNGKRHRMEVIVLEVIPLKIEGLHQREYWKDAKDDRVAVGVPNDDKVFKLADHLFFSMTFAHRIPWPAIVNYALENNIIIHTEHADYYLLVYYFIATLDALSGSYGPPKPEHFSHFAHGIYRTYTSRLYTKQFNSGSANAWYIWAISVMRWYSNELARGGPIGKYSKRNIGRHDDRIDRILDELHPRSDLDEMDRFIVKQVRRYGNRIKWAELYVEDPEPEHPLYAFVEDFGPFGLPDKEFKYDRMEPWHGLINHRPVQNADGKQTRIVTATKEKPLDPSEFRVVAEELLPKEMTKANPNVITL